MPQWINHDFERPSPELLQEFKGIPTSILGDSMNRFNTMDAAIRPLKDGTSLLGVAFTIQMMESSNWEGHVALTMAKAGDVIVIAARGGMYAAVWGHMMTTAAKKVGIAGVIVDGCIRDYAENKAESFPIYYRGIAPGGPHKGWKGNLNVPVACAGVVVSAGDIIVGDDDGIAVVPLAKAEEVLAEAKSRLAKEQDWYRRIEAGETTADILGLEKPE